MQRRSLFVLTLAVLAPRAEAQTQPRTASPPRPRTAPATRAAVPPPRRARSAAASRGAAPAIDPPPTPSRTPGFEAAPIPRTDTRPPLADTEARTRVQFGVPTPPEPQQGSSFRSGDPTVEGRQSEQTGGGLRFPSPGATVRLPF